MNKENKYKNKRGSEYRMKRASGPTLLPVSSLPSAYGIGCFSREAYDFVDWLAAAGQSDRQILRLWDRPGSVIRRTSHSRTLRGTLIILISKR